jgi:hypothetical protein
VEDLTRFVEHIAWFLTGSPLVTCTAHILSPGFGLVGWCACSVVTAVRTCIRATTAKPDLVMMGSGHPRERPSRRYDPSWYYMTGCLVFIVEQPVRMRMDPVRCSNRQAAASLPSWLRRQTPGKKPGLLHSGTRIKDAHRTTCPAGSPGGARMDAGGRNGINADLRTRSWYVRK